MKPILRRSFLGLVVLSIAISGVALPSATASPGQVSQPERQVTGPARRPVFEFPSADSTVVPGFMDGDRVGRFYSVEGGHMVSEVFRGPSMIKSAVLRLFVVDNYLQVFSVDWTLSINGTDVCDFRVEHDGYSQYKQVETCTFPTIVGRRYAVKIRVTNEVPGCCRSHALIYNGSLPHSITLRRI